MVQSWGRRSAATVLLFTRRPSTVVSTLCSSGGISSDFGAAPCSGDALRVGGVDQYVLPLSCPGVPAASASSSAGARTPLPFRFARFSLGAPPPPAPAAAAAAAEDVDADDVEDVEAPTDGDAIDDDATEETLDEAPPTLSEAERYDGDAIELLRTRMGSLPPGLLLQ